MWETFMKLILSLLSPVILFSYELAPQPQLEENISLQQNSFLSWFGEDSAEQQSTPEPDPFLIIDPAALEKKLREHVLGQEQAIKLIMGALQRYQVGVNNPNAPIASLFFIGPSGVGKTLLARELAKNIFGDEKQLIRVNMAEYSEKSSKSRLIGAPIGYVGAEEGGQLTEALKKNRHTIVLLDEIDKAAPEVLKIFIMRFEIKALI